MTDTQTHPVQTETAVERPVVSSALVLSGGLKTPDLMNDFGWPLLCLQQDSDRYVYDVWLEAFAGLGLSTEQVHVMTDEVGRRIWDRSDRSPTLIQDQSKYRGPAGVLRDAHLQLSHEQPLIVIEHSRMLASPELLEGLVDAHRATGNAISVATNPDNTFSGILIAEAEAIEIIPQIGFMDIKEQWLPAAHTNGFQVARVPLQGWSYQIRSRSAYLEALNKLGAFGEPLKNGAIGRSSGGMNGTRYADSLIASGSQISPSSSIAHSAVSVGASIGDRAIVVRSIIGPGARIANDAVVVDSTVKATDDPSSE